MDTLIAFAAGRGTVGSGYLSAGRLKRRGLREEVERTLLFSNCRTRHEYNEADVLLAATVQFNFKVVFLSEERRERLYVVPVNLFSNVVQPELAERLSGLTIEPDSAARFPEAPMVSVETAYQTACRALRHLVAEEAARQQVRVAQRFAVEFGRISDYYGQVIAELERRRGLQLRRVDAAARRQEPSSINMADAAPAAGEGGAAETASSAGARVALDAEENRAGRGIASGATVLAQKIESVQRERERKLRELGDTYGMRVRARLSSARCLWQPKAFFKVSIDRGSITRTLLLAYDGLLERLELPTCESCRCETRRLWASPSATLLCPACAGQWDGMRVGAAATSRL
jgi:hypothetical protein